MARALAVFSDTLQCLLDQVHIPLINVEAQQPQASSGAPTDAVQKLQRLTNQVIVGFVVLIPKEILQGDSMSEVRLGYLRQLDLNLRLKLDLVMTLIW